MMTQHCVWIIVFNNITVIVEEHFEDINYEKFFKFNDYITRRHIIKIEKIRCNKSLKLNFSC